MDDYRDNTFGCMSCNRSKLTDLQGKYAQLSQSGVASTHPQGFVKHTIVSKQGAVEEDPNAGLRGTLVNPKFSVVK